MSWQKNAACEYASLWDLGKEIYHGSAPPPIVY